jgi:LysM repeat protein
MDIEERNRKPKGAGSSTPAVVLAILFGIVVLLLYAGWNLMSDDASNIADMSSVETTQDADIVENTVTVPEEREEVVETPEPVKVEEPKKEEPAVEKPKATYSGETATHTVKDGETFFGIANKFNTTAENLKALNPEVNPNGIKVGITKVKVPVQAVHTVGPGDILRVVASKYGISVETLMAANGKKKNHSERGEKLLIPHKTKV